MKLSIVIPVYNAEKFLKKCINSILIQSYKEFEVILINDGSKDKSKEICDEFSKKDNRIKVIHKKNQGVSSARNDGIRKAKGDYIIFVDSDDYFDNNYFFEKLIDINSNNNDLVLYSFKVENLTKNKKYITKPLDEFVNEEFLKKNKNEKIYELIKRNRLFVSPWTKLISRDLLMENKLFFDESLKTCEDIEWGIRLYRTVKDFHVTDLKSYNYVIRDDSLSGSRPKGSWRNRYAVIKKHINLLSSDNALKSILAIQFPLMIGDLVELKGKEGNIKNDVYEEVKELDKVLKYSIDKRSKIFKVFYNLLGLKSSIQIMDFYINRKRS